MHPTKNEKNKRTSVADDSLKARILSRLQWDARVSLADVSLLVRDRRVTVLGDFDRSFRRNAVLNIVRDFPGLREIDDRTSVRISFVRTDKQLRNLLNRAISELPLVGTSSAISVEVVNGTANFFGHVTEARMKALASRLAWELSGIRDCNNLIRVVPFGQPSVHNTMQIPISRARTSQVAR